MTDAIERIREALDHGDFGPMLADDVEELLAEHDALEGEVKRRRQYVELYDEQIMKLEAEIERLRASRDDWMNACNRAQEHRDGANAQLTIFESENLQLRNEIERLRADAERLDWLTTRLEDVQIDGADPNDHYYGDEEHVPYPVLWRRAIDAARGQR